MQSKASTPFLPERRWPILVILLLAAWLNLYRPDRVAAHGLGKTYYAAAVQSMLASWRNFFYLAVDPAGFVALDKPPLAFWLQALLAKAFGFTGLDQRNGTPTRVNDRRRAAVPLTKRLTPMTADRRGLWSISRWSSDFSFPHGALLVWRARCALKIRRRR